jgi:hypothetical protein
VEPCFAIKSLLPSQFGAVLPASYAGVGWLSLPFIPSGLPTAVRLFGTEIILSQRILKLTKGEVITMLIPPDRASEHRAWA